MPPSEEMKTLPRADPQLLNKIVNLLETLGYVQRDTGSESILALHLYALRTVVTNGDVVAVSCSGLSLCRDDAKHRHIQMERIAIGDLVLRIVSSSRCTDLGDTVVCIPRYDDVRLTITSLNTMSLSCLNNSLRIENVCSSRSWCYGLELSCGKTLAAISSPRPILVDVVNERVVIIDSSGPTFICFGESVVQCTRRAFASQMVYRVRGVKGLEHTSIAHLCDNVCLANLLDVDTELENLDVVLHLELHNPFSQAVNCWIKSFGVIESIDIEGLRFQGRRSVVRIALASNDRVRVSVAISKLSLARSLYEIYRSVF